MHYPESFRSLTYTDFMGMDVVIDENLCNRARVVTHYNYLHPVILPGFSADPDLTDFEIRELAFDYYRKLKQVLYGTQQDRGRDLRRP